MSRIVRNDYTFIKRLKKLQQKYSILELQHSSGDTANHRYNKIYLMLGNAMIKIKEDMLLRAIQCTIEKEGV